MDKDQILEKLFSGEIKLYEIEKYTEINKAIEIRSEYIEKITKKKINSINNYSFNPEKVYGRNAENVIGGATLPLGIAGPIKVIGENANGEYFIPIATTEGALIASINRGAKAIAATGGVKVVSEYVGITRAPLFKIENIAEAKNFKRWIELNFDKIKEIANKTDKYLTLKTYTSHSHGKYVWIRLVFHTGDAMGMNMAVIATKEISNYIEANFQNVTTLAISGNMCIDKKPAAINSIEGRGRIVEVEATLSEEVVNKYLRCTIDEVIEVNHAKTLLGSMMAGSLGFNAHVANMIAGVFIATGQDPAHVVDASLSSIAMKKENNNLYISLRIPALNIATVGGGTGLETQRESLDIILSNVSKELSESEGINQTDKLAEIIGGIVLAGELSLHSAFASKSFVKAHEDLGRGKNKH